MQCPCNPEQTYAKCCKPFLEGNETAPTAEALMRSRYSAYALEKIDYLRQSYAPEARSQFDEKAVRNWSQKAEWDSLEIVDTEGGTESDEYGIVEFVAHYKMNGEEEHHHERAEFRKEKDEWFFMDRSEPVRRTEPKLGRNDPCHCGSGKKFKKCHG